MSYMVVGIVVGVITILLAMLTATFPETKTLATGNGSMANGDSEKNALTSDDSTEASTGRV